MTDLDISKKHLDAALLRLDTLVRAAASRPGLARGETSFDNLISENEKLRSQLASAGNENKFLKRRLDEMAGKLDTILARLEQIVEANDAANED